MSWKGRIKDAAYTSPSGRRLTFDYEDLSKSYNKRGTVFEFADLDGSYVQHKGISGRRLPIRCWFSGAECDTEADGFEALLDEDGVGQLEHPLYPTVSVAPFGEIKREDNLKSGYNQVSIDVVFFVTLGIVYPSGELDLGSSVSSSVDAYNAASAAQFARQLKLENPADENSFKNKFQTFLKTTQNTLKSIAATTESVNDQFETVNDSINRGLDILVGQPLTLAFQTKLAIQAPGRAAAAIKDRLTAFGNLAASIFGLDTISDETDTDTFLNRELFASGYMSGSVVSVINNEFETQSDALEAAEIILTQMDDLTAWRDLNWDALPADQTTPMLDAYLDTGEGYQQLLDAVSLAAGFLVQISFTLQQERTLVLTRARTIMDLGAELYGAGFEDKLNFFIDTNKLTGSEIIEIPSGRTIVYYV